MLAGISHAPKPIHSVTHFATRRPPTQLTHFFKAKGFEHCLATQFGEEQASLLMSSLSYLFHHDVPDAYESEVKKEEALYLLNSGIEHLLPQLQNLLTDEDQRNKVLNSVTHSDCDLPDGDYDWIEMPHFPYYGAKSTNIHFNVRTFELSKGDIDGKVNTPNEIHNNILFKELFGDRSPKKLTRLNDGITYEYEVVADAETVAAQYQVRTLIST